MLHLSITLSDAAMHGCPTRPARGRAWRPTYDPRVGSRARTWSVLLAAAVLGLTACSGPETSPAGTSPTTPSAPPPAPSAAADPDEAAFAAGVSADRRSFVDQRGEPWFGVGDTAWSLFGQLSRADVDRYLDDRAGRGFNLVLASVLENHYSDDPPNNAEGNPPFVGDIFRSEPNEAYWEWVDYVVEAAQARGITLLLVPAYLGFDGADDGLAEEVADASEDEMASYGRFLGDRYGQFPNIAWLLGHDQMPSPEIRAKQEAMASQLPADDLLGVGGESSQVLGIPQWSPSTLDLDFETVYSYRERPVGDVTMAWAQEPTRPVMFLEGRYEQEGEAGLGAQLLRLQQYGAFGGGASASLFGNNPMWHFESVALYDFEGTWQENLASLGSQDAALFGSIVRSLDWSRMVPDHAGRLVAVGAGEEREQAAVRFSATEGFVYLPSPRPTELDLAAIGGPGDVAVRRVDPRSGAVTELGSHSGRFVLPDPGINAAGDGDWVYLLERSR
jgi:hypothetical protein